MSKPKKRLCKFREVWKADYSWLAISHLESFAHCTVCNKDFSVSHGGLSDINNMKIAIYTKLTVSLSLHLKY